MDREQRLFVLEQYRERCSSPSCAFCSYVDVWANKLLVCWNIRSVYNGLRVRPEHLCDEFYPTNSVYD